MKVPAGSATVKIDAPLFDKPASHKHDPETSRIAERKITKSGKRKSLCIRVFEGLMWQGQVGTTNGELSDLLGIAYERLEKRVSDLRNAEWVKSKEKRLCATRRTPHCAWITTAHGREQYRTEGKFRKRTQERTE